MSLRVLRDVDRTTRRKQRERVRFLMDDRGIFGTLEDYEEFVLF